MSQLHWLEKFAFGVGATIPFAIVVVIWAEPSELVVNTYVTFVILSVPLLFWGQQIRHERDRHD